MEKIDRIGMRETDLEIGRHNFSEIRRVHTAKNINVGLGICADTNMRPLVFRKQQGRVTNYIRFGEQAGTRTLTGGKPLGGNIQSGCYVEPTVFDNVKHDMKIVAEETFAPMVVAAPFEELDAVIPPT